MERIFIGILLALIPVVNFIFAYNFSKKEKALSLFKKHWACYYFDWIFVVFNFIFVFCFSLEWKSFLVALFVALVVSSLFHLFWIGLHKKEKKEFHMYNFKLKKMTNSGWVHFIFLTIELALALLFFVSGIRNVFSYLAFLLLLVFFISTIFSSRHIHGRIKGIDEFFFVSGLLILIGKLVLLLS